MLVSSVIHRFGACPCLFRYPDCGRRTVAITVRADRRGASQPTLQAGSRGDRSRIPQQAGPRLTGASSLVSPKEMHPAFFGCFDWHSSVHGHWMLVRLLKQHPQHARSAEAKKVLQEHLTREKIEVEAAYFGEKENRSFERMYGGLGSCDLWPNSIRGTIHRLGFGERTSSHWRRNR